MLLIAVGDELLDRDEDPALDDLVRQLMDRLLDADTWEIADDARATIPRLHHLWGGTRRFDLTIEDSDEDVGDEEDIGEDYGIAALVHGTPNSVHSGVQVRENGAGPHHAEEELELVVPPRGARKTYQGALTENERVLTLSESLCHPWGTLNIPRGLAETVLVLMLSESLCHPWGTLNIPGALAVAVRELMITWIPNIEAPLNGNGYLYVRMCWTRVSFQAYIA